MLTKCWVVLFPVCFIFRGIVLCRGRPLVPPHLSWWEKEVFSCKEKFTAKTEFPHPPAVCSSESTKNQRFSERKAFFTGKNSWFQKPWHSSTFKKHRNDVLYMTIRRKSKHSTVCDQSVKRSIQFDIREFGRIMEESWHNNGTYALFFNRAWDLCFSVVCPILWCLPSSRLFALPILCPLQFGMSGWREEATRTTGFWDFFTDFKVWPGIQIETNGKLAMRFTGKNKWKKNNVFKIGTINFAVSHHHEKKEQLDRTGKLGWSDSGEPVTRGVGWRELYLNKLINTIYSKLSNHFFLLKKIQIKKIE